MNPAARVPLARLLTEGSLERVPVDAADLRFVRHGAEYRAETVSSADARERPSPGDGLRQMFTFTPYAPGTYSRRTEVSHVYPLPR